MDSLRDEFLNRNLGNVVGAALDMGRALMAGDEATFKAGYTAENALLAVSDVFDLSADQFEKAGRLLGADEAFVARHAATKADRVVASGG